MKDKCKQKVCIDCKGEFHSRTRTQKRCGKCSKVNQDVGKSLIFQGTPRTVDFDINDTPWA